MHDTTTCAHGQAVRHWHTAGQAFQRDSNAVVNLTRSCRADTLASVRLHPNFKRWLTYLGSDTCCFAARYAMRSRTCSFVRFSSWPSGMIETSESFVSAI